MIKGDSVEYDLLQAWANFDCDGYYSCEIGVRSGLGSKIIMDNIKNNYMHIGVDPYGDLVYQHCDDQADRKWKGLERGVAPTYSDKLRDQLLKDFKWYIDHGKFTLANMTDTLFMTSPRYNEIIYAFVHFDGPHTTRDVITEAVWFANRSAPNTRFVFDDYPTYDMKLVVDVLKKFGFSVLKTVSIDEKGKQIIRGENKLCLEKRST